MLRDEVGGSDSSVSFEAPSPADGYSPEPGGARVLVNAVGSATLAPLMLEWSLKPDPSDYTRTDTYTLSLQYDGATTELIHHSVSYTKTLFQAGVGAPHPELCGDWGEAIVDLRSGH